MRLLFTVGFIKAVLYILFVIECPGLCKVCSFMADRSKGMSLLIIYMKSRIFRLSRCSPYWRQMLRKVCAVSGDACPVWGHSSESQSQCGWADRQLLHCLNADWQSTAHLLTACCAVPWHNSWGDITLPRPLSHQISLKFISWEMKKQEKGAFRRQRCLGDICKHWIQSLERWTESSLYPSALDSR